MDRDVASSVRPVGANTNPTSNRATPEPTASVQPPTRGTGGALESSSAPTRTPTAIKSGIASAEQAALIKKTNR